MTEAFKLGVFFDIPEKNLWRTENMSFINGWQGNCLAMFLHILSFLNSSVYIFSQLSPDLLILEGKGEISDQCLCKQWIGIGVKDHDLPL